MDVKLPFMGDGWHEFSLQPRDDIVVTDLGDQLVLLDPRDQEMYSLHEVGRFIWLELPDQTLGSVARGMAERYGLPLGTARDDLLELVSELYAAGILEPVQAVSGR